MFMYLLYMIFLGILELYLSNFGSFQPQTVRQTRDLLSRYTEFHPRTYVYYYF